MGPARGVALARCRIDAPRDRTAEIARIRLDAPAGLEERLAAAGVEIEFAWRGPIDYPGYAHAAGCRSGAVDSATDPAYSGVAAAS